MNSTLSIFIALFLTACASTHPGTEGKPLNNDSNIPIIISAENIDLDSTQPFQLIDLTIENKSNDWLRIKRSEVLISDPGKSKLSVVVGQDLKDWAQATQFKLQKDDHNNQMLQLGLLTASSVALGSKDSNPTLQTVGALGLIGTSAWVTSDVLKQALRNANQSEKVPENHLYHSFSVPGKMFTRKWVLLNKPVDTVIKTLYVEIETVDGAKESYAITF
jgi:hypothetical protein